MSFEIDNESNTPTAEQEQQTEGLVDEPPMDESPISEDADAPSPTPDPEPTAPETQHLFECSGLTLGEDNPIFESVSETIDSSTLTVVLGTPIQRRAFLLSIAGVTKTTSGRIWLDGEEVDKSKGILKSIVGLGTFKGLSEMPRDLTVRECISRELAMCTRRASDDNVDSIIDKWGLFKVEDDLIDELSNDFIVRVDIALASINGTKIVVIEDVESDLGTHATLHVMRFLSDTAKKSGIAFIVGLSDEVFAKYADKRITIG